MRLDEAYAAGQGIAYEVSPGVMETVGAMAFAEGRLLAVASPDWVPGGGSPKGLHLVDMLYGGSGPWTAGDKRLVPTGQPAPDLPATWRTAAEAALVRFHADLTGDDFDLAPRW